MSDEEDRTDTPSEQPDSTESPQDEVPEQDSPSLGNAAGVLGEAFGQAMRVALRRGRSEVERAAHTGRHRLQLRQLKSDRDAMLRKIGMEVLRLVEAGEVSHPGLVRSAARVAELDAELADLELRRARAGADAAAE
jgi:hypothetical protein